MNPWRAAWSGAIQNFPGLQSLVTDFEHAEADVVAQVEHYDEVIRTYFEKHPGKNGSIRVDGHAVANGEHTCALTIAAIPQEGAVAAPPWIKEPIAGSTEPEHTFEQVETETVSGGEQPTGTEPPAHDPPPPDAAAAQAQSTQAGGPTV